MVDRVIEIPLPGRTFCGSSHDETTAPMRVTLGSFVAGPENRLVSSAVSRLLPSDARPATSPVPAVLVIYGPTGSGKTHIARGLVRSWQEHRGSECAEYFTAADFRHTLADAIKTRTVSDFRDRVRERRLLVVDDIDCLPRDEYLQEELRYTIDDIEERGGMFVAVASMPPGQSSKLSADVRSRLAGGLELRLDPPEEAARERIARHISAALGWPLSPAAARRLAGALGGTAGDVSAALFEINADRSPPAGGDLQAVERYLVNRVARRPALRDIVRAVAKYYRVPQKVLKSSSRRQSAVFARAVVVYLARELTGVSYQRIGGALGGRDHSTIMHNYQKITERIAIDPMARHAMEELRRNLNGS